ncbi:MULTISPECIES: hypothetical protein [Klebsiella]|uniref:hypothetical protein n=2 Tax=Klebsiella pneumoniae complex TaxID=3390273 RepID=UPI001E288500|nr:MULTISPECIES: hypothetical protein [Klebsiella]MCD5885046.1 hypothetical protein [Klebsiella pneumoniae]MDK1862124.1 hypothetical protein [Klebsiella pneumoniae]
MKVKILSILGYALLYIILAEVLMYTNRPRVFIGSSLTYIIGLVLLFYFFGWLELNAQNLLKQPLFIASIIVPLQMFILYGLWAWDGHSIDFTSKGFNNFLDISKLPLLILASSVPLAAIINNIHRTIQTESQIEKTQNQINLVIEKNKTDSYYSHLKSYSDIFQTLPKFKLSRLKKNEDAFEEIELSVVHPYTLYKNIFKSSSINNGYSTIVNDEFITSSQNLYNNINKSLNANNESFDNQLFNLQLIEADIIMLCRLLGIDYKYQEHLFSIILERPKQNLEGISTSFTDEKQIKQMLWGLRDVLIELYTLIDKESNVFRTGKNHGDHIPDYALYDERLFYSIFPISNDKRI